MGIDQSLIEIMIATPYETVHRLTPAELGTLHVVTDIAEGETLIEYKGELITWEEALRRHPHDPSQPNHTFYFHIDDERVIDGGVKGNAARWINHSCDPNCASSIEDRRIYIDSIRDIQPGEELSYDYGLVIDEPMTKKLKAEFPCWCGSEHCRGTLLAPQEKKKNGRKKKKATGKKAGKKAGRH
jgi:SET domain-containing protein